MAVDTARPQAVSKGLPGAGSPKSPYEKLLASLKVLEATAQPSLEEIKAILAVGLDELSVAERTDILSRVARLVADRNLELGQALIGTIEDFRDRHNVVSAIVEAVAGRDPVRAADWVLRLPDPQLLKSACHTLGMKWGQLDVEACRAWAEGVPETCRLSALEGLTWSWTLKDPRAAYEWAAQLPESEMRDEVFVKMAKMLAVGDPQRTAEWALEFPEGPGRGQALEYALFQWAGQDVSAAAAWVAKVEDQELLQNGLVAVARSWSNLDPANATAWAAQFPEGPARKAALLTTARKWAETDPVAAARWIERSAHASDRDSLFANVTSALATAPLSRAEAWLGGVTDPDLRAVGERILSAIPYSGRQ